MRISIAVILMALVGIGCESFDKVTGTGPVENELSLVTVSCCRAGETSEWPSNVPESHREDCDDIKQKTRDNFVWPNSTVYVAMNVDCGNGHHDIGDEYY